MTYDILPAFTLAEKTYWEQTGTIVPINLSQTGMSLGTAWSNGADPNYHPLGRLNVIGGTQPGPRPDIGIINEYAAQAMIRGTRADWQSARLFTLGTSHYPWSAMLNETTGRIPALNNGPPNGPGGTGVGTAYKELGAPFPQTILSSVAQPLQGVPIATANYTSGFWSGGNSTYISHEPSFDGVSYLVFGRRDFLDLTYLHSNRAAYFGNGIGPGDGLRDDIQGGNHYWGLFLNCCQTRGSDWAFRDKINAAMLGVDNNDERIYANDVITENGNYYPHWLSYKDGLGTTNYSTSLTYPNNAGGGIIPDTYIGNYGFLASCMGWVNLRATRKDLARQNCGIYRRYLWTDSRRRLEPLLLHRLYIFADCA